uniref:WH2 domain-containing protein n=1 Tax=Panagrolaimus sp. PS1159 TaxID=55785 RepID=A0AC35FZU1_9BILA
MPKKQQQSSSRDNTVPPVPLPPSTPPDQRMSSVASYATFIAENDKRKPLIGHTGLKAAANSLKNQKKVLNRMKESAAAAAAIPPIPPAPAAAAESETYRAPKKTHDIKLPIVESLPKYKSRRKSESYLDEEDLPSSSNLIKATSTSILAENISAPVVGKQQFRIPDDAK